MFIENHKVLTTRCIEEIKTTVTEESSNTRLHNEDQCRAIDSQLTGITEYDYKKRENYQYEDSIRTNPLQTKPRFSGRVSISYGICCAEQKHTHSIISIQWCHSRVFCYIGKEYSQ